MTPELLRTVGEALYGPRWQSDLARDLGVSNRTVRYWFAGDVAPPKGVTDDLRQLCAERGKQISEVRKLLRA